VFTLVLAEDIDLINAVTKYAFNTPNGTQKPETTNRPTNKEKTENKDKYSKLFVLRLFVNSMIFIETTGIM
jgi:hypothetical protein